MTCSHHWSMHGPCGFIYLVFNYFLFSTNENADLALQFDDLFSLKFQKNVSPFQLKLAVKASKSEKEMDPEYEEKMVNMFLGRRVNTVVDFYRGDVKD